MTEDLERILSQLTQADSAAIQQATAQLKMAFRDPAVIPALCAVMTGSQDPQIRQSAAVMLRMRVKKHWKKISPDHRESLKAVVLQAFQQETEHVVRHSLSQLSAVLVKHETPDRWPALLNLLNQSTKSSNPQDRQVGLLLLSKVVDSNPEAFKPHYRQLLRLFDTVLQDLSSPTALYYCILTLTAITAHTGQGELNMMRSLVPRLSVAIRHLVKADQDQASEAMEVFDEMMESDISVMVPHVSDIVRFWLEIAADASLSDSLRMKALSCTAFLIRLKSKVILKQKLLSPILQTVFPVLSAAPPPGQEDPEDQEDAENGEDAENPKHLAAQVIDTLAMHLPPEKLFQQLTPFMQACLSSKNPYEQKAGLMCLAVLAEGCADHMRTRMLPAVLQTVCQSLSDSNQLVRSAGLFALGQFSEHLQPDVSKYCAELMPLLMGYLSGLNQAKTGHVTKAFYALENFLENLGGEIQPYLPSLMETMLGALNNSENLKIKELAVSAIGAIANAAKEMLVPYFPPVIESLKASLTDIREEVRCLQTQALGLYLSASSASLCLSNPVSSVLGSRVLTYSLFSAVSTVSPESLTPHLSTITSVMLLSLKSTEGVTAHQDEEAQFVLLDDDDDDDSGDVVLDEEGEKEGNESDITGFSVENAYIDEKEDACDALGELALNTGTAFLPFLEVTFQQVFEMRDFPHEDVRRAAFASMGQFCCAQHKVWQGNPTEDNHQALQKLLSTVLPSFLEAVRQEHERQVVMAVLESMNGVLKSCQGEALRPAGRLGEISQVIRSVLKKKTVCQDGGGDEADDEQQAEFDAMLQEFAGEGIPLLASAVPADTFYPFLNELLPLIMNKAKSSCTVAERSFAQGTLAEIMQSLAAVSGGRPVAGRLSNRLLPVMMAGVRDSDPEVRNNSVFGLGSLAKAAGPIITEYPVRNPWVVPRYNTPCVPLEQVFPALLSHLPLKVDLEENRTVFDCMAFLYSHNPSLVVSHIKAVLSASSHVIGTKDLDADGQDTLLLFLRKLAQHHSCEFQCAVMSLPSERKAALVALVTPV
uniref:Importin 4 n=1 Tax=Paramormyrops kingsleyae TaxID=1676925 RepID=A0A3B3S1L4_9TELE